MSYNMNNSQMEDGTGNVWSSGSHGGSLMNYSNSNDSDSGARAGGSYRGSFGNNNARRSGGYGFRRQNDNNSGGVEILTDAIFIQNLPKNITRDQIFDIFSTVGPIKTDDRSGGPKIWIYKDRMTGEANGRATVTYEDDETANQAISKYNDQHIDSIGAVVRVQLAQRRNQSNNSDHNNRAGYRGARSNWETPDTRQNYNSGGNRRGNFGKGFSNGRSGATGGFHDMASGSDSFPDGGDRGNSYRNNRNGPHRGASRGNTGSSNYSPY